MTITKKYYQYLSDEIQQRINQALLWMILVVAFCWVFSTMAMERVYTSEIKNLKKEVAQLHENINASNQITQESLSKIIVEVITNKEVLSEFQQWMTAPPKKGTVELPEVFRLSLAPYPIFTPITD